MKRKDILTSLKKTSPEVLIIGAGINGVGTFRDLALNGVNVLLIDRGDFCSGASSASSHMAHGGIRYLENGEFRLVREAVRERNRMIENAPHIVKPLPTVVPMFKIFSGLLNAPLKFLNLLDRPSERGALVIKIGLIFYDAFTQGQGTVPPHKFVGRRKSLESYPRLHPDIKYTATYYDGQILSPERMTVELVLDGESEGPHARALNYVSLVGRRNGTLTLKDETTGRTLDVAPRIIINAAGPWIDSVNSDLGLPRHYIGGTKGSHLVLDHPELRQAIGGKEFFFENQDGRIVLIFPFYDKVIVGTSDIPMENPDQARCTDEEIDYFIKLVARVFPKIKVGREHIVFEFSGVRPLEYSKARTTGQISRDHSLLEDTLSGIPLFSLVGGKWTSYRAFAEQVTDKVLGVLGRKRGSNTQSLQVGGGKNYPFEDTAQADLIQKVADQTGLDKLESRKLFERYGTRVMEMAQYIGKGRDRRLKSAPDWTRRELEFIIEHEKVVHLDDLILRRSTLAWLGQVTRPLLAETASLVGDCLGWDEKLRKAEVVRTLELLKDRHGIKL